MRIPLHLLPNDHSPAAETMRALLAADMFAKNPKGFRTKGKRRGAPMTFVEQRALRAGLVSEKDTI